MFQLSIHQSQIIIILLRLLCLGILSATNLLIDRESNWATAIWNGPDDDHWTARMRIGTNSAIQERNNILLQAISPFLKEFLQIGATSRSSKMLEKAESLLRSNRMVLISKYLLYYSCCATQLPVATQSRLMGYGAWQHAPGTSHLLTHVLWCQLVLLILD